MGVYLPTRHGGRARAGFLDTFEHYPVNGSLRRPWVHLGDGGAATFVRDSLGNGELRIPQNFGTVNGGGESYEYMPFTKDSGLEFRIWNPVTGVAAQGFSTYMTNTWADIGAAFTSVVGIRLMHAPAAGGDTVQIAEFANPFSFSNARATFTSPVAFNGEYLRFRVWVDDDQFLRVWLNDIYLGAAMVSNGFKLGPRRRCVRFLNTCTNDVWVTELYHYDRPGDFPDSSIFDTVIFEDTFNRANGAVGNGWTTYGSDTAIVSNGWGQIASFGSDGLKGIIRPSGITNGRMRVEAIVGGAHAIRDDRDSSIFACVAPGGTSGLRANVFSNKVFLSRWTGSITSPTMFDFSTNDVSVSSGDHLALNLYDGAMWLEVNGIRVCWAVNVGESVNLSNDGVGLGTERALFANSHSWTNFLVRST